jgi:hypothetical protein
MTNRLEGRFVGRSTGAADVQFGHAKNGSEQIAVMVELLHEELEGRKVTWFGSFATDESTKITMRTLRHLGWTCDDLTVLEGLGSTEVDVVIKYEEYNGKEQMRVNIFSRDARVEMKNPMSEEQKRAFAARMKANAVLSRTSAPTPRMPKPAARPIHQADPADDIPF